MEPTTPNSTATEHANDDNTRPRGSNATERAATHTPIMEDLDKPTMDNIFGFFGLSPSCRDNGIACSNRRANIVWRQMNRLVVKRMLHDAAAHNQPVDILFILDLDDIV